MRRALLLVAAALLTPALLFAGHSSAGRHGSRLASRLGHSDVQKLADQRADAERWLDERHDWGDHRERYRQLREVAWRASTSTLEVDGGQNGGVIVTGWGRDSVRVIARIDAQARSQERARELVRAVRIVNQDGQLVAEGPEPGDLEIWRVTFDVLAPRTMELRLDAHNGPLCVADMDAHMELETVNGPLTLAGVAGDVHARTQNGPLAVSLTGTRWRGAGLDASTQNGPVALAVPRGYSCMLETGTINGPVRVDIPVTIQGRINGHRRYVNTKLGAGGPPVRAITTNGPAVVSYAGEREIEGDEIEN